MVAVPDPTMLPVMLPQVSPLGPLSVRVTVEVNPFNPPTVIVVDDDCPALMAVGFDAEIVKSGWLTVNVAVVVWVRVPLVPVMDSV